MIIFRNPGLIELAAVTTMGVSVKTEGAFGRFGTGIKYGVASVLRGGGSVTIHRGQEPHTFTLEREAVRGTEFDFVCLDGIRIGFTTQLGRDWQPWMVLREFGCNALDEGGEFWLASEERPFVGGEDGHTVIDIEWPDLETAYKQRSDLFLEGEALFVNDKIRILPGPSAHLFYRGIRVFKTQKPCQFTYDILSDQPLTEDRTLAGSWGADSLIRDTLLSLNDTELVRQAITAGDEYHEATLNFSDNGWGVSPSTEFIKAATIAREGGDKEKMNDSARKVLAAASRRQQAEEQVERRQVRSDNFQDAIGCLLDLGIEFTDEQSFVTVSELPGEARSMLENGTIFLRASLMVAAPREIATELVRRWVDLKPGIYGIDTAIALLTPMLLDAAPDLKRQRIEAEERQARRDAAEAERIAAEPVEEMPVVVSADDDDSDMPF